MSPMDGLRAVCGWSGWVVGLVCNYLQRSVKLREDVELSENTLNAGGAFPSTARSKMLTQLQRDSCISGGIYQMRRT